MDCTLPSVTFTPEEAAATAMALAAQPGRLYEEAARAALLKVLTALDPEGRERIAALAARVRRDPARHRSAAHPAGRARRSSAAVLPSPPGVEERLAPVVHLRSVR